MGCYQIAVGMGLVADRAYHLRRHLQLAGHALFFGVQNAAGDHELDEIDLFRPGLFQLRQGFGNIRRCHSHRTGHVSAGDRDSLIGGKNAGANPGTGCDLIPQAGVEIAQTADRPDGGDAA